jgi:two-component system sensor histidine kinase DesK
MSPENRHAIGTLRGTLGAWLRPAPDSHLADAMRRGKSPQAEFIHLLWSVWVFITPAFGMGYDLRWALLTLASFPLFLFLYARTLVAPCRHAFWYPLAMIALCFALMPWYPSGLSYFVFGCVMLAPGRRQRFGLLSYLAAVLGLGALVVGEALWVGYPWQSVVFLPPMTMVIALIVGVEGRERAHDVALRLSHDEVRRLAATAERERIGRDLHDLLGHTLSLVALKSELAGKLVERDPKAARRELDEVTRVAREALTQVRSAVTGIRAAGIAAELASARLLLELDGVAFRYALAPVALPPALETVLAMTLREAVTNIQRHARAQSASATFAVVSGEVAGTAIVLRVIDDGRGGTIAPGNGLCGMRERIEALGGNLRIDSAPARGTTVEASLPLPAGQRDEPMPRDADSAAA